MSSKVLSSIWGAFVADAYSLSYHWVYNTADIPKPLPTKLQAPAAKWHSPKGAGAFTHYGDQTLILLESIVKNGKKFDLNKFLQDWVEFWNNTPYQGVYRDGATKNTLANIANGLKTPDQCGSNSHDFSAVGRFAPLLLVAQSEDELAQYSVAQTKMTHNNEIVLLAADFFARVTYRVINNKVKPVDAISKLLESEQFAKNETFVNYVNDGLESASLSTSQAIQQFGPACGFEGALPGAVHVIAKYQNKSLHEALAENTGAGGDSAARGLVIGAVLGAHFDKQGLPEYTHQMEFYSKIDKLLSE